MAYSYKYKYKSEFEEGKVKGTLDPQQMEKDLFNHIIELLKYEVLGAFYPIVSKGLEVHHFEASKPFT